jgi:sec-independent protein translocase protein TatA
MGGFSLIHWIVVILVVVLLFGAGRVSGLMGDVAKGIKSFKKGMAEEDAIEPEAEPSRAEPKAIEHKVAKPAPRTKQATRAKVRRAPKSS